MQSDTNSPENRGTQTAQNDRKTTGTQRPRNAGGAKGGRGRPQQGGGRPKRSGAQNRTRNNKRPRRDNFRRPAPKPLRDAGMANLKKSEVVELPPIDPDAVRIIPLGGVEEVGRNMTAIETPEGIIVSDAGFQFMSDTEAPGIDYVLPNTRWLEKNKDRILALFITHGHLDHIGGIPYIIDRIGNPPIYTQYLTSLMIKKRHEEFPHLPKLNMNVVEIGGRVQIESPSGGNLVVKTFPVTHSIPDSMGLSVHTKHGNVVLSGDLKLEHVDGEPTEEEKKVWGELGKDDNIVFIADSTNAERGGFSIPETKIYGTLEEIITAADGRLIIGLFASNFHRMIHIVETAEKLGKKIVLEGRSVKTNIEIAQRAEFFKPKPGTIIPSDQIDDYAPDKIVIIATGAQGEEQAALMRIATGRHKTIKFTPRDTIVLSSSVIPGNEISVQRLKDNLYRHGLNIVHYRSSDVHSTGHGYTGELIWMREQIKPRFVMPAYGFHSMLRNHAAAHVESGFPKEGVIIADNGMVIEIKNGTDLTIRKETVPSGPMMVDGFSIGDMQEVVIRDRQALAKDGMFVIIATVNVRTGQLKKSPDIISRGFVYLRESQGLLSETRLLIKKSIEDMTHNMNPVDLEYVKSNLTDTVERYLLQKTSKRPMVIPVLIGV
ncbi:MAG: ribonuclease J [Patescibacteria group bacterium UBA2163]